MKALFFSLPLHGHTNPTLPLVRELAERGEQIVYYSTEEFEAKALHAGAQYREYGSPVLRDLKRVPERMEELAWLLMRATGELLSEQLDAWRAQSPDYLIADSVAPWGQWAAKLLGAPLVTSVCTLAVNRHVLAYGMRRGVRPRSAGRLLTKIRYMTRAALFRRELCRLHGVSGPGIAGSVNGSSELNIVYTSRHFQPCADTFDQRYVFVGPSMAARSEADAFPWDRLQHRVAVFVSMGTLFNTDDAFYRSCYQAFAGEDYQVILATGRNVQAEDWGPAPANFIVQPHVPQLEVLARTAAFVTHGGLNSVGESLSHGVPLLVIPQMGEQMITGRRVEELGAGLYLSNTEATAEKLRLLVRRLLAERSFAEQAEAVRQSFEEAGGVARAAGAIWTFTRRKP